MDIFPLIGVALLVAVICVLLRQYRPEYAMLTSLSAGVILLLVIVGELQPVLAQIGWMLDSTGVPVEYISILIKALGICIVTQLAGDACKDAGEGGIAGKIEMAGKVAVLTCSLPLFRQVLAVVQNLLRLA
jgi:Stage III sporulation protein AC/AD protein family.